MGQGVKKKLYQVGLNTIKLTEYERIQGMSFLKNCGAASVEEYNRVIKYFKLS